jgi:hypothetical protein
VHLTLHCRTAVLAVTTATGRQFGFNRRSKKRRDQTEADQEQEQGCRNAPHALSVTLILPIHVRDNLADE